MNKDYYLIPNDIKIRKKNNSYNRFRVKLGFSSDLDYRFLSILEENKNNELIPKENIDVHNLKNLSKSTLLNYPDLKKRTVKNFKESAPTRPRCCATAWRRRRGQTASTFSARTGSGTRYRSRHP